MPIRLSTTLPTLAFATEIQDLGFSGGTPGKPCHIMLTLGGTEVLNTSLTPDTAGHFALHDLGWLISTHASAMATQGKWLTELRIEADSTLLATVSIMPCRQRLYINGADFVQRSFLTMAGGGCKVVPKLASERLVWKPSDEEREQEFPVSVRITRLNRATGAVGYMTSVFKAEAYNDELLCYNTSPGYIVGDLEGYGPFGSDTWQSIGYEVTVGQRTMRYRLAPWDADAAPVTTLDFTNVFGLSDSLYIWRGGGSAQAHLHAGGGGRLGLQRQRGGAGRVQGHHGCAERGRGGSHQGRDDGPRGVARRHARHHHRCRTQGLECLQHGRLGHADVARESGRPGGAHAAARAHVRRNFRRNVFIS